METLTKGIKNSIKRIKKILGLSFVTRVTTIYEYFIATPQPNATLNISLAEIAFVFYYIFRIKLFYFDETKPIWCYCDLALARIDVNRIEMETLKPQIRSYTLSTSQAGLVNKNVNCSLTSQAQDKHLNSRHHYIDVCPLRVVYVILFPLKKTSERTKNNAGALSETRVWVAILARSTYV